MGKTKEERLAEVYLKQRKFHKAYGFAINTEEMNPEAHDEIMYAGKSLNQAIKDYVRKTSWWVYEPSDGEQIFEDIWEAIDYAEESSDVTFASFKRGVEKP